MPGGRLSSDLLSMSKMIAGIARTVAGRITKKANTRITQSACGVVRSITSVNNRELTPASAGRYHHTCVREAIGSRERTISPGEWFSETMIQVVIQFLNIFSVLTADYSSRSSFSSCCIRGRSLALYYLTNLYGSGISCAKNQLSREQVQETTLLYCIRMNAEMFESLE